MLRRPGRVAPRRGGRLCRRPWRRPLAPLRNLRRGLAASSAAGGAVGSCGGRGACSCAADRSLSSPYAAAFAARPLRPFLLPRPFWQQHGLARGPLTGLLPLLSTLRRSRRRAERGRWARRAGQRPQGRPWPRREQSACEPKHYWCGGYGFAEAFCQRMPLLGLCTTVGRAQNAESSPHRRRREVIAADYRFRSVWRKGGD